jgi:hypothetical protein
MIKKQELSEVCMTIDVKDYPNFFYQNISICGCKRFKVYRHLVKYFDFYGHVTSLFFECQICDAIWHTSHIHDKEKVK